MTMAMAAETESEEMVGGGSGNGNANGGKTSVWWDMDKCGLPEDGSCDPTTIANKIASALGNVNCGGPLTIFAYGDMSQIPLSLQLALSSTGITLTSSPSSPGGSIMKIVADMLLWAIDNPAPANYLLISGDSDFSYALHQLRIRRYNILLAQPHNASMHLAAAAKIVWLWTTILAGEPMLTNGEPFQFGSNSSYNRTDKAVSESLQLNESGGGNESRGKQIWRSCSEADILRTPGVKNDIGDQSNRNVQQTSLQLSIFPHEFFSAKKRNTDPSWSIPHSSRSGSSLHNGAADGHPLASLPVQNLTPDKLFYQQNFTQNELSAQPHCAPHSFFQRDSSSQGSHAMLPMQNATTAFSSACTNIISYKDPEYISNPSPSQSSQMKPYHLSGSEFPGESSLAVIGDHLSNSVWGPPGCPRSSAHAQGLAGIVLLALHTLKEEKIIPTEENIMNCILYGDSKYCNTDTRIALNHALEQQMVVRQTVGAMEIYIIKNTRIWNCVNPLGGNPKQYSKATWNDIERYLSSQDGQFRMSASECRYEAATYLKKFCLKSLALGDVIQILNMIINTMKWITVHRDSGWQPIHINLAEMTMDAY